MTKSPEVITTPAFVDMHVHLREPGTNKAETIQSGTRAALLGGYALVADMPNNPGRPTWTDEAIFEKHQIAKKDSFIPIGFYAGWQPESEEMVTNLLALSSLGLKLYGAPTTGNDKDYEAADFRIAVYKWHKFAPGKPILFHSGENNLRDMIGLVAKEFKHPLHICHINDPEQVDVIQKAKSSGLQVTSGVTPHHLIKTSHDTQTEGWFARMQPPLAHQPDTEKLVYLLSQGKIDVIETDHAPHSEDAKWKAEEENPDGIHDKEHTTCFGVPGIEFAVPLMFYQAKRRTITMERIVDAMSVRPAAILGVKLNPGTRATWEMRDYRIEDESASTVRSTSARTPFLGKLARGVLNSMSVNYKKLVSQEDIIDQYPQVVMSRDSEI